jgi:hypothetical protein
MEKPKKRFGNEQQRVHISFRQWEENELPNVERKDFE